MVRWMCGVSLKDRRRSEDLCNLLGINCVADVVRRGRLRWFGHLERKSVDDWVSACRGLVVEGRGVRTGVGRRGNSVWDMKLLGLHPEWAIFKDDDVVLGIWNWLHEYRIEWIAIFLFTLVSISLFLQIHISMISISGQEHFTSRPPPACQKIRIMYYRVSVAQ